MRLAALLARGILPPAAAAPRRARGGVRCRYGAYGEKLMYGKQLKGMIRSSFVIDGAGIVGKVFPRVRGVGHAEQVLAALQEL
jgi:peroxiredoxin